MKWLLLLFDWLVVVLFWPSWNCGATCFFVSRDESKKGLWVSLKLLFECLEDVLHTLVVKIQLWVEWLIRCPTP